MISNKHLEVVFIKVAIETAFPSVPLCNPLFVKDFLNQRGLFLPQSILFQHRMTSPDIHYPVSFFSPVLPPTLLQSSLIRACRIQFWPISCCKFQACSPSSQPGSPDVAILDSMVIRLKRKPGLANGKCLRTPPHTKRIGISQEIEIKDEFTPTKPVVWINRNGVHIWILSGIPHRLCYAPTSRALSQRIQKFGSSQKYLYSAHPSYYPQEASAWSSGLLVSD